MAESGTPINRIAKIMRDKGVVSRRGNPASYSFIHSILQNGKYKGVYSFADVVIQDGMPAIVDADTFDRAQRTKPRPQSQKADYRLSGRAFCEYGHMLHGETARGKTKTKTYHYYTHSNHVRIGVEALETTVVEAVRKALTPEAMARIVQGMLDYIKEEQSTDVREIDARIRDVKKKQRNLLDAVENGLNIDGINERAETLGNQLAELQAQKDRIESNMSAEEISSALGWFSLHGSDDDILRIFVNKVVVFETGKVAIVLNFRRDNSPDLEEVISRVESSGSLGMVGHVVPNDPGS